MFDMNQTPVSEAALVVLASQGRKRWRMILACLVATGACAAAYIQAVAGIPAVFAVLAIGVICGLVVAPVCSPLVPRLWRVIPFAVVFALSFTALEHLVVGPSWANVALTAFCVIACVGVSGSFGWHLRWYDIALRPVSVQPDRCVAIQKLCAAYPPLELYRSRVADQGRMLTLAEAEAMNSWAANAERLEQIAARHRACVAIHSPSLQ